MSMDELMMLESNCKEWSGDDSDGQTLESEAWINDLINEQIERELNRQYLWY